MLNFKKLASTLIFSILAFQSTACAVPRYAKVVLLGGKGSGKTTIQKLINKDYDINNIPHTTQISYISVPVFYDNKGNFTFDEDRDVQRYNKEVILNICDTPAIEGKEEDEDLANSFDCDEDKLDEVAKFIVKRPNVLVFLANAQDFDFGDDFKLSPDYSFIKCFYKLRDYTDARNLIILTNSYLLHNNQFPFLKTRYLKTFENDPDVIVDAIKVLTLYNFDKDEKQEESQNYENNNPEIKFKEDDKRKNITKTKEISLEYIAKEEEAFNANDENDLKKYADIILSSIARSVYRYGIDRLEFDNNAVDWSIVNGKLKRGH